MPSTPFTTPDCSFLLCRAALLGALAMLLTTAGASPAQPPSLEPASLEPTTSRVALHVDTTAAEAVLDMLRAERRGESVDVAWERLLESTPYRRLHEREAAMGRAFTDESFRELIASDELGIRADALRRTLGAWTSRDLSASAARVLAYLPPEATIRATVFPMIKPRKNSFVFDTTGDPAIFLALDPELSAAQFENIVLHELHHIGLASLERPMPGGAPTTPADTLARWTGAFGEGMAMLAAAGGLDVHPHAASPAAERARWDRDMSRVDRDLAALDAFFAEILDGTLDEDTIRGRAMEFFGVQGPWYTVGYQMATTVERRFGRAALIDCMRVPPRLLLRYDEAVRGATWSPRVLDALRASASAAELDASPAATAQP